MQIQIECRKCGKLCVTDLGPVMAAMIDASNSDSVYGGYFCKECADELLAEEE